MDESKEIGILDPIAHFNDWYAEAQVSEPSLPDAVALATASTIASTVLVMTAARMECRISAGCPAVP